MCEMLSNDTVTARKSHQCSWCGQKIEAGSRYVRQFVLFDGDTCTNKFHPECDEAVRIVAREEGGCFQFQPGENERPQLPHHQE